MSVELVLEDLDPETNSWVNASTFNLESIDHIAWLEIEEGSLGIHSYDLS
jgi:hypothetical protein